MTVGPLVSQVRDEGDAGKQVEENQQRRHLEADTENFKKEQ